MEKKYGLQLRVNPSQPKKPVSRPPLLNPLGNSDDEDDVEREISRQAYKTKSLRDIEEQHKKALEEDPSVFDYDGVYDDMKQKLARPIQNDRQERKPKYIQMLVEKAKIREKEQEIVYERKIAKERSKDDHIYAGKDKYVTSAYKKKLAERDKWAEEQRLRDMLEEKDDVTKKADITDFYFNLSKNVAFGAEDDTKLRKPEKQTSVIEKSPEKLSSTSKAQSDKSPEIGKRQSEKSPEELLSSFSSKPQPGSYPKSSQPHENGTSLSHREEEIEEGEANPISEAQPERLGSNEEPQTSKKASNDHHKRTQDALVAAKERFLARKKAKEQ